LEAAEHADQVPIIADGLVTKGSTLAFAGRVREGTALLEAGLRLAASHGLPVLASRAANNLVVALIENDPTRAVVVGREGVELARRYGLKGLMVGTLANTIEVSLSLGDWAWIDDMVRAVRMDDLGPTDRIALLVGLIEIRAIRGQDVAEEIAELERFLLDVTDATARSAVELSLAIVAAAQGRLEEAHDRGLQAAETAVLNEPSGVSIATAASIRLGRVQQARDELARLESMGARGPALASDVARHQAALAALEGRWDEATVRFQEAWRLMREQRLEFTLAVSQLEYLVVAPPNDRAAADVAGEAQSTLSRIGAQAYLRQLELVLADRSGTGGARIVAARPDEVPAGA
jgi:hypothetical protein